MNGKKTLSLVIVLSMLLSMTAPIMNVAVAEESVEKAIDAEPYIEKIGYIHYNHPNPHQYRPEGYHNLPEEANKHYLIAYKEDGTKVEPEDFGYGKKGMPLKPGNQSWQVLKIDPSEINHFDVELMDKDNKYITTIKNVPFAPKLVKDMIEALPLIEELTLEDKEKVEEAREAYNELTRSAEKNLITNLEKLVAAEERITELEEAKPYIEKVIHGVYWNDSDYYRLYNYKNLPESENRWPIHYKLKFYFDDGTSDITVGNPERITTIHIYNKREAEEITHFDVILYQLEGQFGPYREIMTIENVPFDGPNEEAREIHNAQKIVGKAERSLLQEDVDAAWPVVNALKDSEEKDKLIERLNFVQSAIDVENMIRELPEVEDLKLEDEEAVVAARAAYEALHDNPKQRISKELIDKLEALEEKIAELEKSLESAITEAEEAIKSLPLLEDIRIEHKEEVLGAKELVDAVKDLDPDAVIEGEELIEPMLEKIKYLEDEVADDYFFPSIWMLTPEPMGVFDHSDIVFEGYVTNLKYLEKVLVGDQEAEVEYVEDAVVRDLDGNIVYKGPAYKFNKTLELEDGHQAISIKAVSQSGKGGGFARRFWIDTTPPELEIEVKDRDTTLEEAELEIAMKDNLGFLELYLFDNYEHRHEEWSLSTPAESTITITVDLEKGENEFVFTLKDSVGHETIKTITIVRVDKVALLERLQEVGSLIPNQYKYTEESWEVLINVHDQAMAVYDNRNATQEEIDNAEQNLTEAIDGLVELELPETDKSKLDETIRSIGSLIEEDYTEESWEALLEAYDDAMAVYEDIFATQEEIDEAEEMLSQAIEALVKKIDAVMALIDDLPDVEDLTLEYKEAVEVAREAYDGLTEEQKALVTNLDKLVASERKIAELEELEDPEEDPKDPEEEPEDPEKPEENDKDKDKDKDNKDDDIKDGKDKGKDELPKTGTNNNLGLYISALLLIVLGISLRRKNI